MAFDKNGYPIPDVPTPITDINTGTVIPTTDPNDVSLAALSEGHAVNPTELFNVKKYDGTTGQVTGKDLQEVLASGDYLLESKEETLNREDEAKYGDKGVQAAALGAARGLSFGVSDQILKESKLYTGDELRGIENANTASSITGEVAGTVLPAIFSGGTSLAAKGATKIGAGVLASEKLGASVGSKVEALIARQAEKKLIQKEALDAGQKLAASEANTVALVASEAATGAMLSEKAAEGAVKVFSKSLEKAGYAANTAKSIANNMLYKGLEHLGPDAANLAIQGALQGAGRLVTEEAFGTAEFNAENVLAYAGIGSLVGGTFGAAIGAGKALVPKAGELLQPIINKIDDFSGKLMDPEKAALRMSELTPSQLSKIQQFQPDFAKHYADISADVLSKNKNIKDGVQFQEAMLKEMDDRGFKIGEILEKSDELAALHRPALLASPDIMQRNLMREGDKFIDEAMAGSTPSQVKAVRDYLDNYVTGLGSRIGKDTPFTAKLMQAEKKTLADKAFKSAMPTSEELSIKGLQRKLAEVYSGAQEQIVRGVNPFKEGVEDMVEAYAKNKKAYQTLANGTKNSKKSIAKELLDPAVWDDVGTTDIAAAVAFGGLEAAAIKAAKMSINSHAVQKRLIMGTLQDSIRTGQIAMAKGLNAMAKGTQVLAKAAEPSIVRSLVSSQLAVRNEDGKKIKPKNEQEAYQNIVDNALVAVNDPERALQQSNRQTSAMFEHAPATAAAIDAKYLQVMQFIASKSKKKNKDKGVFDFNVKTSVSGFETAKMARYLDAITNPQGMLSKAAKGNLSREHVEVMKSIFPEMHKSMKQQTLDFISKNETKLKYSQKLQLGLLLDMQAHESMQPQNIQALQGLFQTENPGAEPTYNQGAVGDMSKSDTMASDLGDPIGD